MGHCDPTLPSVVSIEIFEGSTSVRHICVLSELNTTKRLLKLPKARGSESPTDSLPVGKPALPPASLVLVQSVGSPDAE